MYQAKYGRFGLGDPFHSMQRDSDSQRDNSFDEAAVKAMYDNQLMQLENLIATQRKAQQRMREQLAAVEKRYHKVNKGIVFSLFLIWLKAQVNFNRLTSGILPTRTKILND